MMKLDSTQAAAVGEYFWQAMETCPLGIKVQLLNRGGVAVYGQWDGKYDEWQGWAALPKKQPALRELCSTPWEMKVPILEKSSATAPRIGGW